MQAKKYVSAKMATEGDGPTGLLSGVEAMLDAEYVTALGANVTSEFWGFKGSALTAAVRWLWRPPPGTLELARRPAWACTSLHALAGAAANGLASPPVWAGSGASG